LTPIFFPSNCASKWPRNRERDPLLLLLQPIRIRIPAVMQRVQQLLSLRRLQSKAPLLKSKIDDHFVVYYR
jgi:hypothetical protein